MVDLSKCPVTPRAHQVVGVEKLLQNPYFMLADEMGAGKTKQVIDAVQILAERGEIDRVIVVCPAPVRDVWYDSELGELKKHLWLPSQVIWYHGKSRFWRHLDGDEDSLKWVITNYEFIRRANRLDTLVWAANQRTYLVLDESSFIKNIGAAQTKACFKLRKACGRVTLLNGTPIAHSPMDLFSQSGIMSRRILDCRTKTVFRAKYAIMEPVLSKRGHQLTSPRGYKLQKIKGWQNLEDLQQRMAPYVIRRMKIDCLDLPPKLDPVALTVPLKKETWRIYKEMKDELIVWLTDQTVAVAPQAGVKVLRLSQICSGFLGGVQDEDNINEPQTVEISREKLDLALSWLAQHFEEDPDGKLLIWSRFRPEVARLFREAQVLGATTGLLWGAQKKEERDRTYRLLDPRTTPDGPVIVFGTPSTGSFGLNFTAAHTMVYTSNDVKLVTRLQSMDRIHRDGQKNVVSYFDFVATGPNGEKTVDHIIAAALREQEDLATWTCSAWIQALEAE